MIGAGLRIGILLLIASPALALSCLKPHLGQSFNSYMQSPASYVIAVGQISPNAAISDPNVDRNRQEAGIPFTFKARFNGTFLWMKFMDEVSDLPLDVSVTCAGPWCGRFDPDAGVQTYFLKRQGRRYSLDIGPCPGEAFAPIDTAQKAALRRCLYKGRCEGADLAILGGETTAR